MRVLFLDIDGVLNSRAYVERAGWTLPLGTAADLEIIDPAAVEHLNFVVEQTRAEIVISSSWRATYSLEALRSLLQQRGFRGRVVGVTPELPGRDRAREIAQWLAEHDAMAFAIVDDHEDAGVGFATRFVQTSFETGLDAALAERLVQILRRDT